MYIVEKVHSTNLWPLETSPTGSLALEFTSCQTGFIARTNLHVSRFTWCAANESKQTWGELVRNARERVLFIGGKNDHCIISAVLDSVE